MHSYIMTKLYVHQLHGMWKNCYSLSNRLFFIDGGEIKSMKGTTQGDSAPMAIYAIAIIPNDSHASGNKFRRKLQYFQLTKLRNSG